MLGKSLKDSCNNGPVTPSLCSLSLLSSPLFSPLPFTDEHAGISEAVTRGPMLSCERKLRNECHSLWGARLEWQQNNGGRYERHGHTLHKHTHTHFFKHISIMYTSHCCHFLEQSRILSSLRWVKFNIKLKHVWNLFEVLQKYVSAAQIASVHYFQDEQEPRCFLITFIYYQVL